MARTEEKRGGTHNWIIWRFIFYGFPWDLVAASNNIPPCKRHVFMLKLKQVEMPSISFLFTPLRLRDQGPFLGGFCSRWTAGKREQRHLRSWAFPLCLFFCLWKYIILILRPLQKRERASQIRWCNQNSWQFSQSVVDKWINAGQ